MKIRVLILAGLVSVFANGAIAQNADDVAEDATVAILNGELVRASEVIDFYESLGPEVSQIAFQTLYPQLLDSTVNRKLIAQLARSQGLINDSEVARKIAFWTERVLEEILVNRWVESNLTDEVVMIAYEKMIGDMTIIEELRASHILVATQAEAYDAISRLESGEVFADLAKELSLGPSGAEGGDLNYFKYEDVIPAFSDIAFSLSIGEYTTEPVETQFGWHVILTTDRRSIEPPSYEASYSELRRQEGIRIMEEFYSNLTENAEVLLFNFDGTPADESGPQVPLPPIVEPTRAP